VNDSQAENLRKHGGEESVSTVMIEKKDASLDMEIVRLVCGGIDRGLMCRCSPCVSDSDSISYNAPIGEAETQAALQRFEWSLVLVDLGIPEPASSQQQDCWVDLDAKLVQHVLSFCEPPAMAAVAGSCQHLRRCVLDEKWDLWQSMRVSHIAVSTKELELVVNAGPDSGAVRVASLLQQTKRLLYGLDDMDIVTASLCKSPPAILEFVCDALWQLLTPSADTAGGDSGNTTATEVTAAADSISYGSVAVEGRTDRRDTSLAFLFKPDADVYAPGNGVNGVHRRRSTWGKKLAHCERGSSIDTANLAMSVARPATHVVESSHRRGSSFRNRSGRNSSVYANEASAVQRLPEPGSAGSYLHNFSRIDTHKPDGRDGSSPLDANVDMSCSILALDSVQEDGGVATPSTVRSWWTPGGYGRSIRRSVVGSRWDVGQKALRCLISTRVLEVANPGAGAGFHSLMSTPGEMIATVRRLLPYTATLIVELDRLRAEQQDTCRVVAHLPVLERVSVALACFVVAVDAQLRVWSRARNDRAAVMSEACAARVVEMVGRLRSLMS
jgi:hypothetical protein